MRAVWTLAMKDLRVLARDRMAVFWVIGFPVLMAFMFGAMFGGGGSGDDDGGEKSTMPVAVVDVEKSAASAEFAKRLEASGDLAVTRAADAAEAKKLVLHGDVVAYVALLGDFDGPGMLGGRPPRVELGVAPSRRAEGGMLRGIVMENAAAKLQDTLASAGLGGGGGAKLVPVQVESVEVTARADAEKRPRPATSWEITFPSSITWGLIGCAACFAISLVIERQSGTFWRLKVAPLTRAHILASKGVACFLSCGVVLALMLAIGVFGLHVRVQNGPGLLVAAVCSALCFTGLMMLLASLGRTEQSASGMGWGVFCVMAMLGGGMVPYLYMPPWMQTMANVSPVKWVIVALEGGIWRGFTMTDMAKPCGVLLAIGVAGFVAGTMILAKRDR